MSGTISNHTSKNRDRFGNIGIVVDHGRGSLWEIIIVRDMIIRIYVWLRAADVTASYNTSYRTAVTIGNFVVLALENLRSGGNFIDLILRVFYE